MSNLGLLLRMAKVQIDASTIILVTSIFIFLTIPFMNGSGLYSFVDSLVGRVILVGLVLYAITVGPLPGIFAFLAVAAVFTERNRKQIGIAQNAIITRGSVQTLGQVDMPHSQPAPANKPVKDTPWLSYDPQGSFLEGGDSDVWQALPSGESEDEKHVLDSQLYPNDRQDRFYVATGLAPQNPNA